MSFLVNPRSLSPVTADVDMKDTSPPTQADSSPIPIKFPLYLGRPEYMEVPKASIEVIDPELVETDMNYIRDTLMAATMGPRYVEPPLFCVCH
jgi:hypothetical protein